MASADTLAVFTPHSNEPPSSNFATLDTRNGHLILDFDASTDETAIFAGVLPNNYAATTGLTVTIVWMASSATSGTVVWEAGFERHSDDDIDLDSDSFAANNHSGAVTAPSASGEVSYDDITFTDGSDMDSLAANESFRLRVTRDADGTNGTDDMTGDSEILRVIIRET